MPNDRPQDAVLTLHNDVLARLAPASNALKSQAFLGSLAKAERMMNRLAGLNTAMAAFSAQAWAMATALVESPALCARLGLDARVLRLDELADLVQVVLEEEALFAADALAHPGAEPGRADSAKSSSSPRQSAHAARPSLHPARARARPPKAEALVKREVRRLLREVRSALADAAAAPDRQALGSVAPVEPGSADLSASASGARAEGQTPLVAQLSAPALERWRAATRQSSHRLDPQARAAQTTREGQWTHAGLASGRAGAGLSRALRLNEAAADLAFLATGADAADDPMGAGAAGAVVWWGRDPGVASNAAGRRTPRTAAAAGERATTAVPVTVRASDALGPAPRRGLTAAIAQAVASLRQGRAVARLAVPAAEVPAAGVVVAPTRDWAAARLAVMTPRWQRTLGAWADAAAPTPVSTVRSGLLAVGDTRGADRPVPGEAAGVRVGYRASGFRAGQLLALAPPSQGPAAHPAPAAADRAAGTPRWLAGEAHAAEGTQRAAAAGPVGLRAGALADALAARHGGDLAGGVAESLARVAGTALQPWRSAAGGYRAPQAERAVLALGAAAMEVGADAVVASPERRSAHASAARAPWAKAAAAAVSAVVAQAWQRTRRAPVAKPGHGVLELARGESAGQPTAPGARDVPQILTARPQGRTDAISAWLAAPLASPAVARGVRASSAGAWLQPGEARGSSATAMDVPHAARTPQTLVPAAVRAALAVFGERAVAPADRSVGAAYLARFLGRPAPVRQRRALADEPWTTVALADDTATEPQAAAMDAGRHAEKSLENHLAVRGEPVLRGLAALEALLAGPGAADALLGQAAERELRVNAAEQTLLAPAADAAEAAAMDLSVPTARVAPPTVAAAKVAPAWPSAQLHRFAPVGLGRGRGLLSRTRAAESAAPAALRARATNARPSGAASWTARPAVVSGATPVGYGTSALGGGELLGLGPGDVLGFFGENAASPTALRGADALASWVAGRRGGAPIRGHAAAVAGFGAAAGGQEFVRPEAGGPAAFGEAAALNPGTMPTNFSYQQAQASGSTYAQSPQATLIEAGGAAARQAQAAARATGPTASARATQAGAMARVLSVTDAPTADMLPLVAPAAHAVVTAAAAKPQSEHLVTSGYGPSQGMSARSLQGAAHSDGAQASGNNGDSPGHDAQDIDALAAKIARSVLLRMQRERERRGQYG